MVCCSGTVLVERLTFTFLFECMLCFALQSFALLIRLLACILTLLGWPSLAIFRSLPCACFSVIVLLALPHIELLCHTSLCCEKLSLSLLILVGVLESYQLDFAHNGCFAVLAH